MKPIFAPLVLCGIILAMVYNQLSSRKAAEAEARSQYEAANTALKSKETELGVKRAALARETSSLDRASNFLRLWGETFQRQPGIDDAAIGNFAGRNGLVATKKQRAMPSPVPVSTGGELMATRISFSTVGEFSRSLRMIGELESAYELANLVETRFAQQGADLTTTLVILYPIPKF